MPPIKRNLDAVPDIANKTAARATYKYPSMPCCRPTIFIHATLKNRLILKWGKKTLAAHGAEGPLMVSGGPPFAEASARHAIHGAERQVMI